MNRFLLLMALPLLLFACQKNNELVKQSKQTSSSRLATNQTIKLHKAWASYGWVYHGAFTKRKTFYAEVANLAYDKKVYVHHKMADGTWEDFELSYVSSIGNNTELWSYNYEFAGYSNPYMDKSFGDEFVLKYVVNGQTYWDNNSGANYRMGNNDGMLFANDLFVSTDLKGTYCYLYPGQTSSSFYVVVDVKNLAYDKQVNIVYTTDGWKTTQTTPLQYTSTYAISSGGYVTSPNVFGVERWIKTISLPTTVNNIEFAVSYKVNGQEYWDNNFGKNHKITVIRY
mgnify:CR=1 FL=1